MLVTFETRAYANITMFGDVAVKLLKLMGHSGTVPSAIQAQDIPAALERLKRGLQAEEADSAEAPATDEDEETVSLSRRAMPLIELLDAAAAQQCDVMWRQ